MSLKACLTSSAKRNVARSTILSIEWDLFLEDMLNSLKCVDYETYRDEFIFKEGLI